MDPRGIYKRNVVYRMRIIAKKNIVFGDNQCFELNEIGAVVWNNLNGEKSFDELVEIISQQYDADKSVIKKDVGDFIDEMVAVNVIFIQQ